MQAFDANLAQYGAVGVILALVLGLFLWAFKRLFDHVLNNSGESIQRLAKAMEALSDRLEQLVSKMDDQHHEVVRRIEGRRS